MRPDYQMKYQGYFDVNVGDKLQGDIEGDALNMSIKAKLDNSVFSAPCDADGFVLEDRIIISNGEVVSGYGSQRFASYLGEEPTGSYRNINVEGGSLTKEDMKKPHIELISFSDFQTNPLTGDFGGEIRLARYFDGDKYIPYYGGAITGNIKEIQGNFLLSEEIVEQNNYKGPKYIQFNDYTLVTN
jgi:PmbA protein